MNQRGKAKYCPKRTANVEVGNKINITTLMEEWVPPKQGHFGGGE